MTSCDTNIPAYAPNTNAPERERAVDFLEAWEGDASFALSELVLMEFYVLLRNPVIFPKPLSPSDSAALIDSLRSDHNWTILKAEVDSSPEIWRVAPAPDFPRRATFDARLVEPRVTDIPKLLGEDAESLLRFANPKIAKDRLHLPGPDFAERVWLASDRPIPVVRSLQSLYDHGRLGGTGYLSILPVDQGVEHSAGASFAANPEYFDPEAIVRLALEGGCNAVASTFGVLGMVARKYAHRIPFIAKINHNELLTYPNRADQTLYGTVEEAWNLGAVAVGATIYFGSEESGRQIVEISRAFARAHELGMATILWCYLRNDAFKRDRDYHLAADLTGQADHLGATIQADIVKQKLPENNGGYKALNMGEGHYGKLDERMYTDLSSDHPIDLTRYQVANGYLGRVGLINSGGASGENDLAEAVRTAVINKRAGGTGLITGRKAFQRPMAEGVGLLHAVQDVYLSPEVTIA